MDSMKTVFVCMFVCADFSYMSRAPNGEIDSGCLLNIDQEAFLALAHLGHVLPRRSSGRPSPASVVVVPGHKCVVPAKGE